MNHKEKLIAALGATAQAMGQQVTEDAVLLMADDLDDFSESQIAHALKTLRRNGYKFCVAKIIELISSQDGRPSADQAWAKIPKEESETGVVTDEMMRAWGVALGQYLDGDRVGAQIAFKREYQRMVDEARENSVAVKWFPSLGHDATGRDPVLIQAVADGLIGLERVRGLVRHESLPALENAALEYQGKSAFWPLTHMKKENEEQNEVQRLAADLVEKKRL